MSLEIYKNTFDAGAVPLFWLQANLSSQWFWLKKTNQLHFQ